MRANVPVLAFVGLLACSGSSSSPNGTDAGTTPGDAAAQPGSDAASGDAASNVDAGPCGAATCTASGFACDPADSLCKPDGNTSHVGTACARTGPGDPSCGTYDKATCNDLPNDGFPGGYCSVEPCTIASLCPIGASCGAMGAEAPACFLNCKSDADCRLPDYKCQPMDQLAVSGASKSVCHLAKLPCAMPADCPSSLPKCTNKVCGK